MSLGPNAKRLLEAIERVEMRSLTWGYVDGSMRIEEVQTLVRDDRHLAVDDAELLIEELIAAKLLFERQRRLRSRFAETVRLMTKTRQIFGQNQWRTASRLVADFRVDRRPRLFPKRDVLPESVWNTLPEPVRQDRFRRDVWTALTTDEGGNPFLLAPFQARSINRLLTDGRWDTGTIVTAGTGSGKTFCFYLPVLTEVAARVAQGSNYTLALAIYPRIELLKDQLREALRGGARARPVLIAAHARALRIGVYYGDTPHRWSHLSGQYAPKSWKRVDHGFFCPLLRCPSCEGMLIWHDDDGERGKERLRCTVSTCSHVVDDLVFTREALKTSGCDVLFITTESLNQRMTERRLRRTLGLDRPSGERPLFVLLDEVHTYGGTQGAQVALMLRRWRNAVRAAGIRWVGLSATLRDPEEFLSTVTGVRVEYVSAIAPTLNEMDEDGCEYQIVLRGDASGQTSLLSTTIQTTMLVGRMADTDDDPSAGMVGRKVFVFTDDLDVTNRLYHNLADAEGYIVRRNSLIPSSRHPVLAGFRGDSDDAFEREPEGQRWWAPEKIGRSLEDRLPLGRTTSQDSGVDGAATVLVATTSLEVGFNDTSVGFIVQHKAPRSAAAFLQRKGRAGRSQRMRPWMITVLSDYGRDRMAFQSFEQLFDPTLTAIDLPVDNLYVLRVQATFALLEWLDQQWSNKPSDAYLWDALAKPGKDVAAREHQRNLAKVLSRLLRDEEAEFRAKLTAHLTAALAITEERLHPILWQPPRGMMLEVIPTLIRRLWCNWLVAFPSTASTEPYARTPLPEFLPTTLFSDLQLPEVQAVMDDGREESVPIVAALNQFVPGRVTRRYAPYDSDVSHWLPIDTSSDAPSVELEPFVELHEPLNVEVDGLYVVRPRRIRLERVPAGILPTSNAQWVWKTQISGGTAPVSLPRPHKGPWADSITAIQGYTYRLRSPVHVVRYADTGEAAIRTRTKETRRTFDLRLQGKNAAIGFEQEVDGVMIDFTIASEAELADRRLSAAVSASCRSSLFRDRVAKDKRLLESANVFQLDWFAQAFLGAAISSAGDRGWSFAKACEHVTERAIHEAISVLFPLPHEPSNDKQHDDADDSATSGTETADSEQKLVLTLRERLREPDFLRVLREIATDTFSRQSEQWGSWLRSLTCETLAIAFADAAVAALPRNSAADNLLTDWSLDSGTGRFTLWLTEQSLGGAGVVEELVSLGSREPRKLLRAVEAALAPSEMERAADALGMLCRLIRADPAVAKEAEDCSSAVGHVHRTKSLEQLAQHLRRHGYAAGRTFGVSANARLFRTGMLRPTWTLLADLDDYRTALQAQLGVIIDLRVFCRIAADHEAFGRRLRGELERMRGSHLREGEAAQLLSGMLWPQSAEVRANRPLDWHPFRRMGMSEPQLVRELLLRSEHTAIDVADADWRAQAADSLTRDGVVRLSARYADQSALSTALLSFTVEPIDAGWLLLYAGVERVELLEDSIVAALYLREAS